MGILSNQKTQIVCIVCDSAINYWRKRRSKSLILSSQKTIILDGEDVAKLLIEKINSNFNTRYNYKNGKNYSYQIILHDNLQQLSNFIVDKKKEFDFVIPKMKLHRSDDLELREKILNMTVDERKQLKINKSTLWHIKKNLEEGKIPKIYEKIFLKIQ